MAETFVELGAEAVHHLTERHWDRGWDKLRQVRGKEPLLPPESTTSQSRNSGRHRNRLPSPERERDRDRVGNTYYAASGRRQIAPGEDEDELESLESRTTQRVTTAYENETDDPVRPVDPQLERQRAKSSTMSAVNGHADDARARSQQPPRSRYYDDDSDYDEHEGRRYRNGGGRGYDDDNYREIIETERYRGPARPQDARNRDSYGSRAYDNNAPYGAGAVAPYRRSANDVSEIAPRRSHSRGRHNKDDRDYDRDDRSYSRSRSRSHGRGWEEKIGDTFSTSMQGLGAGLVGAVAGGMAGRQFGNRHKERDVIIGAIIGGLGANAAEKQWAKRKERRDERDDGRWGEKHGGGDTRRARSNVR